MTRETFHTILKDVLGSNNVYYQPPAKIRMVYPCIRYARAPMDAQHADNHGYILSERFTVTCIGKDPDWVVPKKIARFPSARQDRMYVSEGLYHFVFSITI